MTAVGLAGPDEVTDSDDSPGLTSPASLEAVDEGKPRLSPPATDPVDPHTGV